jgi:hypothetical protein
VFNPSQPLQSPPPYPPPPTGIKPSPSSIYSILVFVQVFLLFYTANTSLVHILALSLLDVLLFEFNNIVLTVVVLDVLTAWIVHTVHFLRQWHNLLSICGPHPFTVLDIIILLYPILWMTPFKCQWCPFSVKNVLSLRMASFLCI